MDTYGHLFKDTSTQAMKRLNKRLRAVLFPEGVTFDEQSRRGRCFHGIARVASDPSGTSSASRTRLLTHARTRRRGR
jgi:hypothetical protein